jgi:hypothetical protein
VYGATVLLVAGSAGTICLYTFIVPMSFGLMNKSMLPGHPQRCLLMHKWRIKTMADRFLSSCLQLHPGLYNAHILIRDTLQTGSFYTSHCALSPKVSLSLSQTEDILTGIAS